MGMAYRAALALNPPAELEVQIQNNLNALLNQRRYAERNQQSSGTQTEIPDVRNNAMQTEEKLLRLEHETNCCVCFERKRSVVFRPCKHMIVCGECSERFTTCPFCREQINEKMEVFQ